MRPVCWNIITQIVKKYTRGTLIPTILFYCHIYTYIHSSYDERIQRKQSAQYRKRRAITVKVTLSSARCDTVSHTPMTKMIFRQVQRTVESSALV